MSSKDTYCTYLTIYGGNLLPPFYIGSSSLSKIRDGYHGSVRSKLYKSVWNYELKNNLHLFKTKVISTHENRIDAFIKERALQLHLNVVESNLYMNMSIAAKTGFYYCSKGFAAAKDAITGNSLGLVALDDIRWTNGQIIGATRKTLDVIKRVRAKNSITGELIENVLINDIRFTTGEFIKTTRGNKGIKKQKLKCPKCDQLICVNLAKRYHFDNCRSYM